MLERRRYKVAGISVQTKYDESLLESDGWFKTKAEAVAWAERNGQDVGAVRRTLHLPDLPVKRGPGRPPKVVEDAP